MFQTCAANYLTFAQPILHPKHHLEPKQQPDHPSHHDMLSDTSLRSSLTSASATASPTSLVEAVPPMSAVRMPSSIVCRTAASTALASRGRLSEYWSSIATDRIAATGFTMP